MFLYIFTHNLLTLNGTKNCYVIHNADILLLHTFLDGIHDIPDLRHFVVTSPSPINLVSKPIGLLVPGMDSAWIEPMLNPAQMDEEWNC